MPEDLRRAYFFIDLQILRKTELLQVSISRGLNYDTTLRRPDESSTELKRFFRSCVFSHIKPKLCFILYSYPHKTCSIIWQTLSHTYNLQLHVITCLDLHLGTGHATPPSELAPASLAYFTSARGFVRILFFC